MTAVAASSAVLLRSWGTSPLSGGVGASLGGGRVVASSGFTGCVGAVAFSGLGAGRVAGGVLRFGSLEVALPFKVASFWRRLGGRALFLSSCS